MANTCGRRSGWLLSSLSLEEDAAVIRKPSRAVLRLLLLLLLLHGCQGSIIIALFNPPLDSCCWIVENDLLCVEMKREVEKAAVTEADIERRRMPPSPPMLLPPDEDDFAAAAVQGAARSNVETAAVAVMAVSQHDNTT